MPKAYELPASGEPFDPERFKLGAPCKRNHIHADGLTLRYAKRGHCVQCENDRALRYRNRCKDTDPDYHAKARARMAHKRATDLATRLYGRAQAKARKVARIGGSPSHLSRTQLWRRWCDFEHACAYCGASVDLQVEHVVPISKGGEHHLGNIVPACHRCNSSKRSKDARTWYMAQPFYEPWRWHNIQAILNKSKPTSEQINLFAS